MSRRTATSIASVLLVLGLALFITEIALAVARGTSLPVQPIRPTDVIGEAAYLSLPALGVFLAWHRPRNPLWVLAAVGTLTIPLQLFCSEYMLLGQRLHEDLPGLGLAAWLSIWIWAVPGGAGAAFVMAIYPDGKLVSPVWRWIVAALAVAVVALAVSLSLQPGVVMPGATERNPLGVPAAAGLVTFASNASNVMPPLAYLIGGVALIVRYRRASGDERQQLKWFAYAVGILILTSAFSGAAYTVDPVQGPLNAAAGVVGGLSILVYPIAVGIGVVRYRLFDIDVVISRTLVYAALAAFITGAYVGIVVGLGSLVGGAGKPNLGLSILATALVAVAFQPLRERLTRIANRLVYGRRASPYEVLAEFSRQVAGSYAGEEVLGRMAQVLAEGTGAESAAVYVGDRQVAVYPPGANGVAAGENHSLEVRHQGHQLGRLEVRKRRGEQLPPLEEKLLQDLAHQAGLVLSNVGLTADLRLRLEELRASRLRLVQVQDEERQRLERNLHDGAQQHLVALKVRLGLAQGLAKSDPVKVQQLLADLQVEADATLETMRELAHGIYPPLLAERGLKEALASRARRATLPVAIEAESVGRHPQELEAAVYFCCLEALQNVQKYAQATAARVRVAEQDGLLSFEVSDDGVGFDPVATARGAGLTNLRDRLEALGGDLTVESAPGAGTTIRGALPLPVALS